MPRADRRVLVVVTVALALTATACSTTVSGSGSRAAAGSPGPGSSASPSAVPSGADDAVALLAHSRESLEHIFGFEATGTLVLGTQKVTVDLVVGSGGGHGTLTAGGVTATLDYSALDPPPGGTGLFITAPTAYWARQGFDADAAASYAGKPVSVPTTSPLAPATILVDQEGLCSLVFTAAGPLGTPSVESSPDVDGQPAVVVDLGAKKRATMTIMTTGQQFPLRIKAPQATLTFGQFGVDPKVRTPTGTPLSLPA